jgi:hypothetical protein
MKNKNHKSTTMPLMCDMKTHAANYPLVQLWNTEDVSRALNIKAATIRYWVHVYAIRFHKLGHLTRFVPAEIMKDFWEGKIGKFGMFKQ